MQLEYEVIYSDRKTITITVERDRSIIVRAPIGVSEEMVRRAVEAKKLWLFEKINHTQKYPTRPIRKEFVTGETIMYLGRYYRLEITDDDEPGVRFRNRFYISRQYQNQASDLFRAWYMERARAKLPPRIRSFAESLGVTHHQILISDLKYRWGSCTPKGTLNFNWRIIKAPMFVIDYLIVHELAHLLESNHTPQFWNIVAVQVPRYETAIIWLREHGSELEEDF